jgi:hypothetical protein
MKGTAKFGWIKQRLVGKNIDLVVLVRAQASTWPTKYQVSTPVTFFPHSIKKKKVSSIDSVIRTQIFKKLSIPFLFVFHLS